MPLLTTKRESVMAQAAKRRKHRTPSTLNSRQPSEAGSSPSSPTSPSASSQLTGVRSFRSAGTSSPLYTPKNSNNARSPIRSRGSMKSSVPSSERPSPKNDSRGGTAASSFGGGMDSSMLGRYYESGAFVDEDEDDSVLPCYSPTNADDEEQQHEDEEQDEALLPKDALLILSHSDKSNQLHRELDLASERLEIMTKEADIHRDSIEEEIKRSSIMRKVILVVKQQLRDERTRRDKLIRQKNEQANAVIDSLKALVAANHKEIDELQTENAKKRQNANLRRQKLEALKEDISYAQVDSEAAWRKGNRRLEANRSAAEKVDRNDRAAWINTLRGGPEPAPPPDMRASVADLLKSKRTFTEVYSAQEEEEDQIATRELGATVDRLEAMVERQRQITAELLEKNADAASRKSTMAAGRRQSLYAQQATRAAGLAAASLTKKSGASTTTGGAAATESGVSVQHTPDLDKDKEIGATTTDNLPHGHNSSIEVSQPVAPSSRSVSPTASVLIPMGSSSNGVAPHLLADTASASTPPLSVE